MLSGYSKVLITCSARAGKTMKIWPKYRLTILRIYCLKKPLNALMETSLRRPDCLELPARRWYTGSSIAEL